MIEGRSRSRCRNGRSVKPRFENGLHTLERICLDGERPAACSAEPLFSILFFEAQHPEAGGYPEGVLARFQDCFYESAHIRADLLGRGDELFRRLIEIALMRKGPVLIYGRLFTFCMASQMACNPQPFIKTLNSILRDTHVHFPADESTRNTVIVTVNVHVVVGSKGYPFPFGILESAFG